MKYRKKPIIIDAFEWTGDERQEDDPEWIVKAIMDGDAWFENENSPEVKFMIRTLEGVHEAKIGDYIIQGIAGEIYPCKPDIFRATYEMVADGRCESPNNPATEALTNILFEECYEAANIAICQPADRKNKHDGGGRIDAAEHSALLRVIAKAGLTDEWREYSEAAQKNT